MRCAVLNVSVGGSYGLGQQRLDESLRAVGDATPMMFWREWPGLPHEVHQGGFKVDAFDAAFDAGVERALWLDSQVVARRRLDEVFALLDERPVVQVEDGWNLGEWTSDAALAIFGAEREPLHGLPISWTKVVGIDLTSPVGLRFLDRWRALRDAGAFDGPWHDDDVSVSSDPRVRGHRHDQTCASWLAHEMGIPMVPMRGVISMWPSVDGDPVLTCRGLEQ